MAAHRGVPAGALALTILAALACATTSRAATPSLEARCELRFSGTSTLHDFEGTAPAARFTLTASPAGRWDADVAVSAAELDTGSALRDREMRAMFEIERWPTIRAHFRNLDADALASTRQLPFVLTIRNIPQSVTAVVSRWERMAQTLEFDADFAVSLQSFGLEAPSVLGVVRVADEVRVRAHVVVTSPHPPA